MAYWISKEVGKVFSECPPISKHGKACSGIQTGNNDLYLRQWFEIDYLSIGFGFEDIHDAENSQFRWFPHKKGGEFRRWYGNCDYVIDWKDAGKSIKENPSARPQNTNFWFKEAVTWSHTSSGALSARYSETGFTFNVEGPSYFSGNSFIALAHLCSSPALYFMQIMNPTLHFLVGSVSLLPKPNIAEDQNYEIEKNARSAVEISLSDWNSVETAWSFTGNPLLSNIQNTLETSYLQWQTQSRAAIFEMQRLEEENNRLFIEAYGLQDELSPEVPEAQITLARADREKDSQHLISYAMGCMMGRYSLDEPGLIYAHAGNVGFDPNRYHTFPADTDGIVPITDELWFEDDAANRINEFLLAVWDADTLEENRAWLAESLGQKGNDTPQETIRRYIAGSFYKNHLQTYKKRPIYWLFTSGKQGAFQALVYLHRYNESTLARMRAEYVVPLTGKIQSRIDMLEKDAAAASSNAERNKLGKDIEKLSKKYVELLSFDEKLRHYADLRIQLDLDDGVKVNYGKFGDLLAEVKTVTGGVND